MIAELITLLLATGLLWLSCRREQRRLGHLEAVMDARYRGIRESLDRAIAHECAQLHAESGHRDSSARPPHRWHKTKP